MTSRKLDEIASDLDDASTTVDELLTEPDADTEKLNELQDTLEPCLRPNRDIGTATTDD